MKKSLLIVGALASTLVLNAQQSPASDGVKIWSKGVPPNGVTEKDDYGDHILSISHRDKDGAVEVHEHKDDVMIIQSGEATLVYSGHGVGMHSTGPGEQQGDRIEGGKSVHVGPGDVITVAAGVPHQFLLPKGGQITYVLVKNLKH